MIFTQEVHIKVLTSVDKIAIIKANLINVSVGNPTCTPFLGIISKTSGSICYQSHAFCVLVVIDPLFYFSQKEAKRGVKTGNRKFTRLGQVENLRATVCQQSSAFLVFRQRYSQIGHCKNRDTSRRGGSVKVQHKIGN